MLLLAIISTSTIADWTNVSTDENSFSIYANPATIKKIGNRIKMWVLFDYRKATYDTGDKVMSIMRHEEYNCRDSQSRLLYISKHSGRFAEGKVVYLNDIPSNKWASVVSGSRFEDLFRYACR
jgi:hypothetical protein